MAKIYNFVKAIPERLQEHFGVKTFKISLSKCKSKKVRYLNDVKGVLGLFADHIIRHPENYDKDSAVNLLKDTLTIYINNEEDNMILAKYQVIFDQLNKRRLDPSILINK